MDFLEAMALELEVVNEIVVATMNLIEEKQDELLNTEQVRIEIKKGCSPEHHEVIDLLLHASHDSTKHTHSFGRAEQGTGCSHPMGCKSVKLSGKEESVLLKFKLQKLLEIFSFEEEHLLPAICGGLKESGNIMWWCALHNRQKSDSLAWYLASRGSGI